MSPLIESRINSRKDRWEYLAGKFKSRNGIIPFLSLLLFTFIGIAAIPKGSVNSVADSHSIINGLLSSISNVKTLSYWVVYSERLEEGNVHTDSSMVKIQCNPHKLYMKLSDGTEIIWAENASNGNAWVHPNYFPYLTVELDPDGMIMRKNQHHGVENAGYSYFGDILKQAADNAGKSFDSRFLYLGEILYNGAHCYKLVVLDPAYKYLPYKVSKGETVLSIARKLNLSEYMIMQHNGLSSFNDISNGQTIMVPTNYGKEMTLYIDKATMLPLLLKVDDDRGLFEQYIFNHLKVNLAFSPYEFSKDNKEYHF
ncbi:MAG: DUF1571 domain-containing protein [Bacteroidia bacterium]